MSDRYNIDEYELDDVERALRAISITEKARALVTALATAENRAMSRIELARAMGSDSVNSVNSAYGNFATKLANALDPTLVDRWKPETGRRGDLVMFINFGPARWTPASAGELNTWVFVMRETLARALANVSITPYTALDPDILRNLYSEELGLSDGPSNPLDDIEDAAEELESLSETEREATILARVGQGEFRDALIEYWEGACSVTGVEVLPALVASHIKPWRDASNEERLDVHNGLLLVGTLDRLFDAGLISFTDRGDVLISEDLDEADRRKLGVDESLRLRIVDKEHNQFLSVHREMYGFEG